jgi:group I intron endonuclease
MEVPMELKVYYLYTITDTLNNKVYIGQTVNPSRRWKDHQWLAQNKQEQYIHRAMAKYGSHNFFFEVIAGCKTQEDADDVETQLIRQYDSQNKKHGYNIAPGGNHAWNTGLPKELQPMYGKKQSDYQKQRCSEVHTGMIMPPVSEETRRKMSESRKRQVITEEWKQKISESNMGKIMSKEARKKISDSHTGKIISEETKKKMSEAKLGKTKSEKTKKRMSLAKRTFSSEQELKIVRHRKSGLLIRELATMFGCSKAVIYNVLRRHK